MNQILRVLIIIIMSASQSYAQIWGNDTMPILPYMPVNNSPGMELINQLQEEVEGMPHDHGEAAEVATRQLGFLMDRLPLGPDDNNPAWIYAKAMLAVTGNNCLPVAGAFNGNWLNTGPKNTIRQGQGLVSDLWVDPTNANRIFACVEDAGLWYKDNTSDWYCKSDNFNFGGTIGPTSIAVNPHATNNFQEMYVTTSLPGVGHRNFLGWHYGQGIWRSGDGGITWSQESTPGVVDNLTGAKEAIYCPFLIGGQQMVLVIRDNHILRKIGSTGAWVDITPAIILAQNNEISDLVFNTDISPTTTTNGKLYIATTYTWTGGFNSSKMYEIEYNLFGNVATVNLIADAATQSINFNFLHPNGFSWPVPTGTIIHPLRYEIAYVNNWLYAMANVDYFVGPTNCEGDYTLLRYNVGNWSSFTQVITDMYDIFQTSWNMHIDVHPNHPEVIYHSSTIPIKIFKNSSNVWQKQVLASYNQVNFHADARCTQIYTSGTANDGSQDIVYWGNDGGVSRTNGNNITDLNSNTFITAQVYDVGVGLKRNKRSIALMHNMGYATENQTNWNTIGAGDGFNTIYDKRTDPDNQRLFFTETGSWDQLRHTNTGVVGATGFSPPLDFNGSIRPYPFPHDFESTFMYLGNRNTFRSLPNTYQPWSKITNTGDLDGFPSTIRNNCRAFSIAPSNKDKMLYGVILPKNTALLNEDKRVFLRRFNQQLSVYAWKNITHWLIADGYYTMTDLEFDDKNENRFFMSLGGVSWNTINVNRVFEGIYDPGTDVVTWNDMSTGLTVLPVVCLEYQAGSDDVIYAGTDAGVYRWDKPQGCWVKFNDKLGGGKMPNCLVNDLEIDYCAGKLVAGVYGRGVWETDLYYAPVNSPGGAPLAPVTLTIPSGSNITWGPGQYSLNGSIRIQGTASLTLQGTPNLTDYTSTCTVLMPRYGTIYLEPNAKLIVNGAKITNECEGWYGVRAHGIPNQIQQLDPLTGNYLAQGWLYVTGNGILENAEEAFSNFGPIATSQSGGVLNVDNGYFVNNRRSAQFITYFNRAYPGGPIISDKSNFLNSHFIVNDEGIQPFDAHVSMWSVRGINFQFCTFHNERNLQANHEQAIETGDATYGAKCCLFKGFHHGVLARNYSLGITGGIKLDQNKFDANELGIQFDNILNPAITNNYFHIGAKQTIVPAGTNWYWYSEGSRLYYTSNFQYWGNKHFRSYTPPSNAWFPYTAGLEVFSSGPDNVSIFDNEYNDLFIGTDIDNTCGSVSAQTGINLYRNRNFNNTGFDFIFQDQAIIKPDQFSINNPEIAARNLFSVSSTCFDWYHSIPAVGPVMYPFAVGIANELPAQTNGNLTNVPIVGTFTPLPTSGSSQNGPLCAPTNIQGPFTLAEFEQWKLDFGIHENSYNNYRNLYLSLIDNGNTIVEIEGIENSTSEDAQALRAEMLNLSPYISTEVLTELCESNILPNTYLFEILMLNPEATRSTNFIQYLEFEKPNPLPHFMIEMIEASWAGETIRGQLEKNMSAQWTYMTELKFRVLEVFHTTPEILTANDDYFYWLQKVPSLRNTYRVIEYLLDQGNTISAETTLQSIPSIFTLEERDIEEYNKYQEIFTFKKDLIENNILINSLDSTRLATLQSIASYPQQSMARSMARSPLCYFYNICYPDDQKALPNTTSGKFRLPLHENNNGKDMIAAYPNPANEVVSFLYHLLDGNEAQKLIVTDISGKPIYSIEVTGRVGQHSWQVKNLPSGNYIYTLYTKGGEKYNGKLLVQHH